jgi:3-oxoacyl-[acyl-carrier-protein] synthase-3
MAFVKNEGIRIAGISCCVPSRKHSVYEIGREYFSREFMDRLHRNVGVETLRFTGENQSSGDLGIRAADTLLDSLSWDRASVGALIFVSQTPDYIVPPTSCRLQNELGLPESCFVIDTNYGCPAYAQSLMLAYQLISSGMCGRALLVTAECHHKYISRKDEQTALIFGDAAAATAIEKGGNDVAFFRSTINGEHVEDLILENYKRAENPAVTDHEHVFMDGETLTKYMFREIPKFTRSLLDDAGLSADDADVFFFHQANAYMIRYLGRKMKLPDEKLPVNIENFGNTSGPSIPLLICDKRPGLFEKKIGQEGYKWRVVMLSYGAGYMISGAALTMGGLKGGQIVEQEE